MDIEGSFDNISFDAITDPTTAGWITNMLTNRFVTINHKSSARRIRVKRGCPQGDILSPLLWNLGIDDLLNYSAEHILGYLQALKTITTIIENWCHNKGLNINALKNKLVMFT